MNIIVAIEDSAIQDIDAISKSLSKLGMRINQVLKIIGIISGSIENTNIESLKIKGVKSIELDKKYKKF